MLLHFVGSFPAPGGVDSRDEFGGLLEPGTSVLRSVEDRGHDGIVASRLLVNLIAALPQR